MKTENANLTSGPFWIPLKDRPLILDACFKPQVGSCVLVRSAHEWLELFKLGRKVPEYWSIPSYTSSYDRLATRSQLKMFLLHRASNDLHRAWRMFVIRIQAVKTAQVVCGPGISCTELYDSKLEWQTKQAAFPAQKVLIEKTFCGPDKFAGD